jgi:hypothetical protein
MKLKSSVGQDSRPQVATFPGFDFMVAERPKYIPGSGPALAPITVMPPHDKDGFIIDKVQFHKQLRYLVGYEHHPQLKVSVRPENILDWISRHALEKWESDQYNAEERRREEEELPGILAREERRRKRLEASSRAAQGINGRKVKRKRATDDHTSRKTGRPAKLGRVGRYPKPGGRRGTPPTDQLEGELFTSPRLSQHSQQPSLSTPSRGLADRDILDPESNDDGSIDTDMAIDLQLNGFVNKAQPSRSTSESTDLLSRQTRSPSISNAEDTSGDKTRNNALIKPKGRPDSLRDSILSGRDTIAATSSREALKIYEELERKKNAAASILPTGPQSPFRQKAAPLSSFPDAPANPTSAIPTQDHQFLRTPNGSKDSEPKLEKEDLGDDGAESEYELHQILDEEIRKEKGKHVVYYLIDWVGDYDNTWEPAENVSPEAIEDYKEKSKMKRPLMPLGGSRESSVGQQLFVTPERSRDGGSRNGQGSAKEKEKVCGQVVDDDTDESDELAGQYFTPLA